MLKSFTVFLLLSFALCSSKTEVVNIKLNKAFKGRIYSRCPAGKISKGKELGFVSTRSKLDCMTQCSRTADCRGVNVCPDTASRRVDCTMLSEQNPPRCNDLGNVNNTSCFFAQRECENGGKFVNLICECQVSFAGPFCERYIRDCKEAYDNGIKNATLNGMYFIQPVTAPSPFQVLCMFQWDGETVPYKRNAMPFGTMTWEMAKRGQYRPDQQFFVGLENLRHLLLQADYTIRVNFSNSQNDAAQFIYFYENVKIGPESAAFDLSFTSHHSASGDEKLIHLFKAFRPMAFCTQDRDTLGCAATQGRTSGWYGPRCNGYNLFADQLFMPIGGRKTRMDNDYFFLERYKAIPEP